MADYSKAIRGSALKMPAGIYNDMLRLIQKDKQSGTALSGTGSAVAEIRIKNMTSKDLGRFNIVAASGNAIDPGQAEPEFDSTIILKGVKPEAGEPICITREPILNEKIGKALLVGVIQCTIDVGNVKHLYADSKPDNTDELQSDHSGPIRILWKESGTGLKRAIVSLGPVNGLATSFFLTPPTGVPGAIDKFHPNRTSAERYWFDSDTEEIVPYDPAKHEDLWTNVLSEIAGNVVVLAISFNGEWFVVVEDCQQP